MVPFDKILFPVDFSEASAAMVPDVAAMARKFNAAVIVLHAFHIVHEYHLAPRADAPFGPEPDEIPYIPALRELREVRKNRLEEFARAHLAGIDARTLLKDGDPALAIEWVARQEKAGLVMMSTKGRGRFRRLLMGSLTAKMLHDLGCPIYTSPHVPGRKTAPPGGIRSILCATRMEPESAAALRIAGIMARVFEARVCLLHVHTPGASKARVPTSAAMQEAFARAVGDSAVAAEARILDAGLPEGIRKAAVEEAADLLVVGRGHARGNVSRIWSHLYRLIRESPCPVLSV